MTIRNRLLLLLLPTLAAIVCLIALFFYFNWSKEILESFKSRLQSVVVAISQGIDPGEVEWINAHIHDPDIASNPTYQSYKQKLLQMKQKLPIINLYIVRVEPVKQGEPVLLNTPSNSSEEVYLGGEDLDNAYRQVFLLDASEPANSAPNEPGEHDFSETGEHQVYFTKKAFVTPIYEARKTHERFMSAYAPIINEQGDVIALVGADVSVQEIDQKLHNAILMIFLSALMTIAIVMTAVFLIADRISQPVQQLNQAALDIAAGNYEANIQVQGPKEIVELANTLNIMSECLVENISRLRESSLIRERMYGEYECSLLLQHYMLQKVIENFQNPHIQLRSATFNAPNAQKGLLLKTNKDNPGELQLTLLETHDQGFAALYELNKLSAVSIQELHDQPFLNCSFLQDYSLVRCIAYQTPLPLIWSFKQQQFIEISDKEIALNNQDMIFLYNTGLAEHFGTEEKVKVWFSKVLRHFAEDGLDTLNTMLTNELNFLARKEQTKRNLLILSLQIKIPDTSV
jgi:HAMP domain-containing protein